MNQFLEWSIDYASENAYLYDLLKIYPMLSIVDMGKGVCGLMFRNWIRKGTLGFDVLCLDEFSSSKDDAILLAPNTDLVDFARKNFGYKHDKGLDFLARISGKYIIGEVKFLYDFTACQATQFYDAVSVFSAEVNREVIKIAILDGVPFIKENNPMYREITTTYKDCNIMSALMLRTYLYTI